MALNEQNQYLIEVELPQSSFDKLTRKTASADNIINFTFYSLYNEKKNSTHIIPCTKSVTKNNDIELNYSMLINYSC